MKQSFWKNTFEKDSTQKKWILFAAVASILIHLILILWTQKIAVGFRAPKINPLRPQFFKVERVSFDPKLMEARAAEATSPIEQRDIELDQNRMEAFGQPLQMPTLPPAPILDANQNPLLATEVGEIAKPSFSALPQDNKGNTSALTQALAQEAESAATQEASEALKQGIVSIDGTGEGGAGGTALPKFSDISSMMTLKSDSGLQKAEFQPILLRLSSDVLFAFDSSEILPSAIPILERVANFLSEAKQAEITIEGHTDTIGEADYNQKLSEARAQSVATWLEKQPSLSEKVFKVRGLGETRPIANPQGNREEQKLNRRVELRIAAQK